MIAYIFKSSLSLFLLFGLYWFLLRREKLFIFIRYFLLFSLIISLILPFISIPVNIQTNESKKNIITLLNGSPGVITNEQDLIADFSKVQFTESDSVDKTIPAKISFSQILLFLYALGLTVSLFRFARNIFNIYRQMHSSESISFSGRKLVLINNQINPYCFFNTIFIYKDDYLNKKIAKEFLTHELEHVRQSHSIDIIILELVRIAYWFNPILLLYSQAIRVNHEYLADHGVIKDTQDIENYADKLLNLISRRDNIQLTSGLNQSMMRRRLLMITKPKSKSIFYILRISLTLCLLSVFFLFLSFKPSSKQPLISLTNHNDATDTLLIYNDFLKSCMTNVDLKPDQSNVINKKVVYSSSGYIKQDTINQIIVLVSNAIVSFGDITIKADSIFYNKKLNRIDAMGRKNISGTISGKPIFKEGSQEFLADEITYNLSTRKVLVKNIQANENLELTISESPVDSAAQQQINRLNYTASKLIINEDKLTLSINDKQKRFPIIKNDSAEIRQGSGEKNIQSKISGLLFLNAYQLKPLGIELDKDGVFYKNFNPNWKNDRVKYSCLSFYCSNNNYLTTNHYSETDVIKANNRNERKLVKMEISRNDFYPVLIGNTKGKQSLDNGTLAEDLKLFPVAICMSETKLRNRKDTIIVWFKPSEALKKALPENVKIEDYLKVPIRKK